MNKMPDYPVDDECLLKVDKAHKALHAETDAYRAEMDAAVRTVELKHTPYIYAARSVLYEALGNAALAGFDTEELLQTMGCGTH